MRNLAVNSLMFSLTIAAYLIASEEMDKDGCVGDINKPPVRKRQF